MRDARWTAMESVPQAVADAATGRRAQCRRVVMAQKGQSLSSSRVVFGEENGLNGTEDWTKVDLELLLVVLVLLPLPLPLLPGCLFCWPSRVASPTVVSPCICASFPRAPGPCTGTYLQGHRCIQGRLAPVIGSALRGLVRAYCSTLLKDTLARLAFSTQWRGG